jgi:Zn-dependent M28 family amino/carboxypeptidase
MRKIKRAMYWLIIPVAVVFALYFLIVNPVSAKRDSSITIEISKANLEQHVNFLCKIDPPRAFENTASLNKVADYIAVHFVENGFKTTRQHYTDGTYKFQNIIANYLPEKEERVVIGAHYDVCGPYQGADDNASGVAGLLEIARLIAAEKPDLDFGIDFVAYSTEEPPYFRSNLMGSAVHADSLKKENGNLKLMIVLEMIGYFNSEPNSQTYPIPALKHIYPKTADFIAIVGRTKEFSEVRRFKKDMINSCDIKVESINTPVIFEGIDFSDHRNYWSRDMKAIMITNTSFFRNANYHTANDTPESLDFDKMTEVVKGCYYALVNLK